MGHNTAAVIRQHMEMHPASQTKILADQLGPRHLADALGIHAGDVRKLEQGQAALNAEQKARLQLISFTVEALRNRGEDAQTVFTTQNPIFGGVSLLKIVQRKSVEDAKHIIAKGFEHIARVDNALAIYQLPKLRLA